MESKVLCFEDIKRKKRQEAFEWADNERKKLGILASPIKLEFESDTLNNKENFVAALFFGNDPKKALLRRWWKDDMMVTYNFVINCDEIKKVAPKSFHELLDSGIRVYNDCKKNELAH